MASGLLACAGDSVSAAIATIDAVRTNGKRTIEHPRATFDSIISVAARAEAQRRSAAYDRDPCSLEKVACGAFCALPSLDGTLRADLWSSKRAAARLSDISCVSA